MIKCCPWRTRSIQSDLSWEYPADSSRRCLQENSARIYIYSRESIYKFDLSVCLFVCLFVANKRQNGWTDRAQIFCGTSCDPREGLWMIKFSKICLFKNSTLVYNTNQSKEGLVYNINQSREGLVYNINQSREGLVYNTNQSSEGLVFNINQSREGLV